MSKKEKLPKLITQETFDDAVQENISEFGMTLTEALQGARDEFISQGVDLSRLVLTEESVTHKGEANPVVAAIAILRLALLCDGEVNVDEACLALDRLRILLDELPLRMVAATHNAHSLLLEASLRFTKENQLVLVQNVVEVLAVLLNGQPDLLGSVQPATVTELVQPTAAIAQLCDIIRTFVDNLAVLTPAIQAARHGCILHETNRQAFVTGGFIALLIDVVDRHTEVPAVLTEALVTLRTLTLDDDIRVAFGKGAEHAKLMVTENCALPKLVAALGRCKNACGSTCEIFKTLAQLAIRDEYCKEIADLGGLAHVFAAMEAFPNDASLAFSTCVLLKGIAGNDEVKVVIARSGGLDLVLSMLQQHMRKPLVVEQSCSAIAAICLRNEKNSLSVAKAGGIAVILRAMQINMTASKLLRMACSAIRNIVSRCPELQPEILAEGAELILNTVL